MILNNIKPFENVYEILPLLHKDERGFFFESYSKSSLSKYINIDVEFIQDNHSMSKKNVIRGMHFQENPVSQQKLLRCIRGSVLEIIVDINTSSKTFLKYCMLEVSEKKQNQVFIPNGYAHGFLSLEDNTHLIYKTDNLFSPANQVTLKWDDPDVKINWPIKSVNAILSTRDKNAISFKEYFGL